MGNSQNNQSESDNQSKRSNIEVNQIEAKVINENNNKTKSIEDENVKDYDNKDNYEDTIAPPQLEENDNISKKLLTVAQNLIRINNYIQELNQDLPSIKVANMLFVQSCLSKINPVLITIEKNNRISDEKVKQSFEEVTKTILLNEEQAFKEKLNEFIECSRHTAN